MKKKILAFVMAVSLVSTGSVFTVFADNAAAGGAENKGNGGLEVIEKLIETDEYPEGTILSEYETINEYRKHVIVREVATAPVVDVYDVEDFDLLDHFGLVASGTVVPGQDNGGWDAYPASYEYNYDNTNDATKYGMWGGNGGLKGYVASSVNDLKVRHKMQMYCDGQDVHLIITYADAYYNPGNGDDYNFYIDGQHVKFKVVYDDDESNLTTPREPGTYPLKIMHEDYSISARDVLGGSGTMTVKNGQLNNVTEITIPLSEMVRQNGDINPDSISMIEFFTPNLMYRRIATSGASSGPVPFAAMTVIFFAGAYWLSVKKRRLQPEPALA